MKPNDLVLLRCVYHRLFEIQDYLDHVGVRDAHFQVILSALSAKISFVCDKIANEIFD